MFASLDVEDRNSIAFPFNNSVICVAPESISAPVHPIKSIAKFTEGVLQNDVTWGLTGPIALSTILNEYLDHAPDVIEVVPHRVLCPWGGNEIRQIYQEDSNLVLPEETRVIHLFAKASGKLFDQVDASWVQNSTSLLAKLIREKVPQEIWGVRADWDIEGYLNARGKHYRGLFELIEANQFKNIMEIGTSAGDTAIGMIRVAGRRAGGEENICYHGIDLFEMGDPETWDAEFTGGYRPPTRDAVLARLKSETKADIHLKATDSNRYSDQVCSGEHAPGKMDLIYIDGGHSIETVKADWNTAQKLMHDGTAVVFDDYFVETPFIGCKVVVDSIDHDVYDVKINPIYDDYAHPWGRLRTQLALVKRKTAIEVQPEHTRNDWAEAILKKVIGR
jgi:hypothetical protein